MSRLFRYDAPLMKAVRQIAHMIVLNFVFMLTCLPIFTIGASAAALYGVMCRPLDDDPAKRYFQLWKQSFACATKAFLLLAAVGGVVFFDYCLSRSIGAQHATVISYVFLGAGFVLMMAAGYVFPLCTLRPDMRIRDLYRLSIQLMLFYLPRSFLIGLIALLFPILALYFPYYFLRFGLVIGLVGFSFLCKLNTLLLHRPLQQSCGDTID